MTPIDSALDPREVLLGYWAHVLRSRALSATLYAPESVMYQAALEVIEEARGQIAVLEEYGVSA